MQGVWGWPTHYKLSQHHHTIISTSTNRIGCSINSRSLFQGCRCLKPNNNILGNRLQVVEKSYKWYTGSTNGCSLALLFNTLVSWHWVTLPIFHVLGNAYKEWQVQNQSGINWLAILFASYLAIPIYIIHFFSINSSYIVYPNWFGWNPNLYNFSALECRLQWSNMVCAELWIVLPEGSSTVSWWINLGHGPLWALRNCIPFASHRYKQSISGKLLVLHIFLILNVGFSNSRWLCDE